MALTLDPATKVISVPQADLSLVSGTLWALDTDQFRKDVMTLLASEPYIWMPNPYDHNGEVTIFGTTYARTLEFVNGFSITFEDTGSAYSIRLDGSNNNIADIDSGVLNPTALTTVVPTRHFEASASTRPSWPWEGVGGLEPWAGGRTAPHCASGIPTSSRSVTMLSLNTVVASTVPLSLFRPEPSVEASMISTQ